MRFVLSLLAFALLISAGPASALDLCFDDDLGGGSIYIFKKIKLPKRALDAVPVAGTRLGSQGVTGSAFRDLDGALRFSLATPAEGCFIYVELDGDLAGTTSYNCLGGFTANSSWAPRDCRELVL